MNLQVLQPITNSSPVSATNTAMSEKSPQHESFWGKDGFTFSDVLDIFNPMQHMPVISKYYREQTQDDASEGSKLVGGALFGGLIGGISGVLSSIANSALRHETRQDIGEHMLEIAQQSITGINSSPESELAASESKKMQLSNKEYSRVSEYDLANSGLTNPFFAQTLEDHTNDYSLSYGIDVATGSQRSRNWGRV